MKKKLYFCAAQTDSVPSVTATLTKVGLSCWTARRSRGGTWEDQRSLICFKVENMKRITPCLAPCDREPINVTSYGLTTANDTKAFPGRNPKNWKVYGKLNKGDQWTELDYRTNGNPTADNYIEAWFSCSHMKCQYFRFEVSEIVSGDCIQLSEFMFDD